MGFFRKMFGSRDAAQPVTTLASPQPSAAAPIAYDAELVDKLLADHARLGAVFARLGELAAAGKDAEVHTTLRQFKSSLQAHVLTENVRFYTYLEKSLGQRVDDARTFREFRRDMNAIARQVVEFVKKWQDAPFLTQAERQQFQADYQNVGKLLEQRLDNEEQSLYPLYRPA